MAKQSLAAATGAIPEGTALAIPDAFQAPAPIEIVSKFNTPYISFAQPAAREQYKELLQQCGNVEDGDCILFWPKPAKPEKLPNFRIMLIDAYQFWKRCDTTGKTLEASKEKKPGLEVEEIHTACILFHNGRAIPCTGAFKRTKCGAIAPILAAQAESRNGAEWIKNGANYEVAVAMAAKLKAPPWSMVVATITTGRATGRSSGVPYSPAKSVCAPTGLDEWKQFADMATSPEGAKAMADVAAAYKDRVANALRV